eukprot:sb/3467678/
MRLTAKKLRGEADRSGRRNVELLNGKSPVALYYDGKRNKVDSYDEEGSFQSDIEDNITIVLFDSKDSEQEYGGYRMSPDGTGAAVSTTVVDYCVDHGVNTHNVVVVAADSTTANTGNGEGSLAHMQSLLGRTLTWNVCLLHHVQLPMKHLFVELGIETKSDNTRAGPVGDPTWTTIGEEMSTSLWERPIAKYQPIDCCIEELSTEQLRRLSSDAQYTYLICLAVTKDATEFPENLVKRRIGRMDNSRWFTTATRVIRLYTSTAAPGHPVLNKLANYVVRVYFKVHARN